VEGQALRDRADAFRAVACVVLGISFDTSEENKLFADAQEFGFPLLSDVDRAVGRRYDVLRQADDQYAEFARRISYLIDPAGMIRRVYVVSDVAAHADEVLADLAALGAGR
jgi:peroxiredoxin Q/BCP